MDLAPGTVLLGKYRVEELIGTGGMARVFRVAHLYLQQNVALKVLLPNMAESQDIVQRFLREAQATVKLRSEHIARVSDVGTLPDGAPFMEMEYLDGNDLNQILRHHGPQLPAIVCDLMLQACEGLSEAHHASIIHRDVKPSNFFITRRPDGSMLLKILDFGISKTPIDGHEQSGAQAVIGTPTYMAPEQMKSGKSADPRSDIWSMGVVMYQLINGRPPFSGESYAELVYKVGTEAPLAMHAQCDPGLHDVIFRCLEKDPNRRWQNVAELARQLSPYASDPASGAQSASRSARILMGSRMHNQAIALQANGGLQQQLSPAQMTPRQWQAQSANPASHARGQMTYQVGDRKSSGKKGMVIATGAGVVMGVLVGAMVMRGGGEDTLQAAASAPAPAKTDAKPDAPKAIAPTGSMPTVAATAPTVAPTGSAAPTIAPTGSAAPTVAATGSAATPTVAATVPVETPTEAKPTITVTSKPVAEAKPTITVTSKPVETKPAVVAAKPAVVATKPVATKPAVTTAKPAVTPTTKPAVTPATTKPATTKPATKPKHPADDSLFDSRK